MAMPVRQETLGVDVAKDWIDLFDGDSVVRIENTASAIKAFFQTRSATYQIAIEPTNRYHERFIHAALAGHHTVYLINPYRLSRYRDAVGVRAKTDAGDARLLYRYVLAEASRLKPYKPAPAAVRRLMDLLRVRGKLTQSRETIQQSLSSVRELASTTKALINRINSALEVIDRRLLECLHKAGYTTDYERCLAIPGIGPLNAAVLVALYNRGEFTNADAFIAFIGLDVRVRDSGKYTGQRKLTKQGNPQIRRLLFNAARSGSRTKKWKPYYESCLTRGLSSTAASVALSRKIARLAFALLKNQSEYREIEAK